MPIDAAVLDQMEANAQYLGEGPAKAVRMLRSYAPFFEHQSDTLSRSVTSPLSTTVTAVETGAANLYYMRVTSPSGASEDAHIQVFNTASGSVNLGTTAPVDSFTVPAGKTRCFVIVPGDDDNDLFSTAISIAATTTHDGSAALGSASQPTVEVLSA